MELQMIWDTIERGMGIMDSEVFCNVFCSVKKHLI